MTNMPRERPLVAATSCDALQTQEGWRSKPQSKRGELYLLRFQNGSSKLELHQSGAVRPLSSDWPRTSSSMVMATPPEVAS